MNFLTSFLSENWSRLPLAGARLPSFASYVLATPRFETSANIIFIVLESGSSRPLLIAKVPRLPGHSASLEREAQNLAAVHGARWGEFDSIPRVVAFELIQKHWTLIETALPGVPMNRRMVRRKRVQCIESVLEWLVDLHNTPTASSENGGVGRLEAMLRNGTAIYARDQDGRSVDRTLRLTTPLAQMCVQTVFEHGDLSDPNILVTNSGKIGVVDWELAEVQGFPATDLFFFLAYVAAAQEQAEDTPLYVRAFSRAFFRPGWAVPYVLEYARRVHVPREALAPLFVLCWYRHATYFANRLLSAEGVADGPVPPAIRETIRTNRFYAYWQYSLNHFDELAFYS